MKEYEELGLSTADVNSIAGIDIADEILQKAQQKSIFSQLFKRIDVEEGNSSFKYPKSPSSTITVSQAVAPNSSIAISGYVFNTGTITARKCGCRIELSNESIEDASSSNKELVQVMISEISNEIRLVDDARAYTIALDVQYNTLAESDFTGGTLAASTLKPILNIISSTLNTGSISAFDASDGKISLSSSISSGTVVYSYSNQARQNLQYMNCSTAKTLTYDDILSMRETMITNKIFPDVLIINDHDFPEVFSYAELAHLFTPASVYPKDRELLEGEIGSFVNMKVLTGSTIVPQGVGILIDTSRLGYEGIFRELDTKVEDLPESFSKRINVWDERDYGISDTQAVGLLVNGNSLASDL